jgi:hypothetical protein
MTIRVRQQTLHASVWKGGVTPAHEKPLPPPTWRDGAVLRRRGGEEVRVPAPTTASALARLRARVGEEPPHWSDEDVRLRDLVNTAD